MPVSDLPSPAPRRQAAFALVLSGTFLANMTVFIVVVALPSIGSQLGASGAQQQLVLAGYELVYAAGLISGGRLGDMYGQFRVFGAGMAVFTLASAVCALAPSATLLVAARLTQGAGTALLVPQVYILARALFSGRERSRAFVLVGVAMGAGSGMVFIATGAASIAAFPLVMTMCPGGRPPRGADGPGGAALYRCLAQPWLLLLAAACAFGGITAFVPLMPDSPGIPPVSLFLMSAAGMAGRWTAGVISDRAGSGRLLAPGVVACVLALGCLAASASASVPLLTLPTAAVYGLGFGALQNDTLTAMFRRAGTDGHGPASTVWNLAYDAGTGLGATAIGWGSDTIGFSGAFAVSAAVIAALTPAAHRIGTREHRATQDPGQTPVTSS